MAGTALGKATETTSVAKAAFYAAMLCLAQARELVNPLSGALLQQLRYVAHHLHHFLGTSADLRDGVARLLG